MKSKEAAIKQCLNTVGAATALALDADPLLQETIRKLEQNNSELSADLAKVSSIRASSFADYREVSTDLVLGGLMVPTGAD